MKEKSIQERVLEQLMKRYGLSKYKFNRFEAEAISLTEQFTREDLKKVLDERIKWKCDGFGDGRHFWQSYDEDNPKEIICMHCLADLEEELRRRLKI
jgi:hypothetical protein